MAITGSVNATGLRESVYDGEYGRAGHVKRYSNEISSRFDQNPAYFPINKIINEVQLTEQFDSWILDDKSSYDDTIAKKKLLMEPGQSISVGEIINVPRMNNKKWLITQTEESELYYESGQIEECNFNLEFTNDVGRQVSIPCVMRSQREGTNGGKYITIGKNIRLITIQSNDETDKFTRDDEFVIDGLTYEVKDLNRAENPGVIYIDLEEYQEGATEIHVYTLDIQETNLSFMISETKQLNIVIREDDVLVSRPVTYTSSDNSIATVSSTGLVTGISDGTCTITASLRDNTAISDTVSIEITSTINDNIEYRFGADNQHKLTEYDTNDYQFNRFNNNVIEPVTFTFSIDYNGNSTNIATLETIDGNNCRVTANSQQIYGTVFLVANEGLDERGRFEINIVSLWG